MAEKSGANLKLAAVASYRRYGSELNVEKVNTTHNFLSSLSITLNLVNLVYMWGHLYDIDETYIFRSQPSGSLVVFS